MLLQRCGSFLLGGLVDVGFTVRPKAADAEPVEEERVKENTEGCNPEAGRMGDCPKPKEKPLNVLIFMSDQHNPHVLGCYGNPDVRTPNLDRLAAEGVRFTNAYCATPLCVPSRMSFMTSRTPSRNRVWNNAHILSSGIPTWAHVLGAAGYQTVLVGRMHFVGADQRHGFARRPLGEFCAGHPGATWVGGPAWTKYPAVTTGQRRPAVEIAGMGTTLYQWFDTKVADVTCDFLQGHAEKNPDLPFALAAGFLLPHCPFIAPKKLFEYYYQRVDIPQVDEHLPATIQRFRRLRGIAEPPLPEQRIRVARAAYFGMCEFLDAQVGRILGCLDQTGLAANTLVIYCSDHGEMAGEHGCWWKSNYYQGSGGVPLIFRLPGAAASGATCDAVCSLMDVGPTLTEAAEAGPMPASDGRSLWSTLQGRHPNDWLDETFSEFADGRTGDTGHPNFPSRMVRSGNWKLWWYGDSDGLPPALFNLENDPDETQDLGNDPSCAAVREEFMEKLRVGWDPDQVSASAQQATADHTALANWGHRLRPTHPDLLPVPSPEIEADVELR